MRNVRLAISAARELAAASVANLDDDPELAVLLAVEAVERSRAVSGDPVPEAEEALHRSVAGFADRRDDPERAGSGRDERGRKDRGTSGRRGRARDDPGRFWSTRAHDHRS